MKLDVTLIHGIFRREIKNRFRCIIEVDGKDELCYVASSSRLSNYISLENKEVLLLPEGKGAQVTKYTLFAAKYRNSYVLLNLQMANTVLQEQLRRRIFSKLGERGLIDAEKKIAGYKTDLFIRDTNTLVEIKTVIDTKREAYFPAVSSERSLQQLNKIGELLEYGYRFCFIFVALSPSVKEIHIDRHSPFYDSFQCCVSKGLEYIGCSLKTTETALTVRGLVKVKL